MPPRSASRKGPAPGPIAERFWRKVERSGPIPAHDPSLGPCWLWMSTRHQSGYGTFFLPGGRRNAPKAAAHRVAWELTNGSIPEGLDVLHRCDVRRCVNPAHLYLGTDADNVRDRDVRSRRPPPRGSANGRARLLESQVKEIRSRYAAGETQASLGASFGVSQGQVSRVVRGVQWADVS